jgi:hypothetical protein
MKEVRGEQPFAPGVNYWPRRKAMYRWPYFDAAEVRKNWNHPEPRLESGTHLLARWHPKASRGGIGRFATTGPRVQPATRSVALDISPESYYEDPPAHAWRLYRAFCQGGGR